MSLCVNDGHAPLLIFIYLWISFFIRGIFIVNQQNTYINREERQKDMQLDRQQRERERESLSDKHTCTHIVVLKENITWNRATEAVKLILPPDTDFLQKNIHECINIIYEKYIFMIDLFYYCKAS